MASLVGHALGALAVWKVGKRIAGGWVPGERKWLLLPVALAVVPDLDVVVSMVIWPGEPAAHRGPSHSIVLAAAFALAAAAVLWRLNKNTSFWKMFAVLLSCALIHPLLDYLMGCGPPVPFFWPFVDRGFLSPVQLIPTAYYSSSPLGLIAVAFSPQTWIGIALEALSLGPLCLAARASRVPVALGFLAASACSFTLTWLIFR